MSKLKKWQLWLIFVITLLLATSIIIWSLYDPNSKTVTTILLVIVFLIMTFSLQMAIMSTFKFKPKKKKLVSKVYNVNLEDIISNLEKDGFTKRNIRFGYSYTKVINETALKVTFVNNIDEYMSKTEDSNKQGFPGMKKCTKFIGFEIFLDKNDKILEQIPDYSFQGNKLYYEGFILENNELIEPNIIEIEDSHKEYVLKLKDLIGAKDVDNE